MTIENELKHYGVLGMKWGVRRYQNKDGSLTPTGKKKYQAKDSDSKTTKQVKKDLSEMTGQEFKKKYQVSNAKYMRRVDRYGDPYMNAPLAKIGKKLNEVQKRRVKDISKSELARGKALASVAVKQTGKNKFEVKADGDTWIVTNSAAQTNTYKKQAAKNKREQDNFKKQNSDMNKWDLQTDEERELWKEMFGK